MALLGPLLLGAAALISAANATPLKVANVLTGPLSARIILHANIHTTKQPKLGTLFVNPGGPGQSGVGLILGSNAEKISTIAGGQYDIVSWDPRRVGLTLPGAQCFKTGTEENAFWEGAIPRAGLEARGNFTDKRNLDEFYEQVDEVDVLLKEYGKRCIEYSPDIFQYVGTAAAVRDMVAMHDVLEGSNKPVDYWGLSYGTAIGIYFVNMFPDRVGRVVLDGVIDPEHWANRPAHEMWRIKTESTDEALTGFVTACAAAGSSGCALATKGSTLDSIRQQIRDLIDAAYDYKRQKGPNAEIGSSNVRNAVDAGTTTTKDIFDFLVKTTREVSHMFGPMWYDAGLYCHHWPARAVERYTGPWNKKLANPILVIGNEADPVTPYISAKKVADALGDSAILIEQGDYGHLSLAMHSTCTNSALRDYFVNNKLPNQDKFCGTDQKLFPGPGITKNSLAKTDSQNLPSTSEGLQGELDKARARSNILLITVIALASVASILLLSLIFSCIRDNRKSKAAHIAYITRGAFEKGGDEQGHAYNDPFMKGVDAKLGGYSRVQT